MTISTLDIREFSFDWQDDDRIRTILAKLRVADAKSALNCIRRIPRNQAQRRALREVLPILFRAMSDAAHPDRVLLNFEKFVHATQEVSALFEELKHEPRLMEALVILFAGSQFLTDVLLRNPTYLHQIHEIQTLVDLKSRPRIHADAYEAVDFDDELAVNMDRLRRFQRRELLRIGSGDLLGVLSFQGVVDQLSNLARSIIRVCVSLVAIDVGVSEEGFSVIALGKLGGRELNYSSDVDLIFVAREPQELHKKLGQKIIWALSHGTAEGFLYRIDMRLRPWGQVGALVPGFDEHLRYLRKSAALWEKQAMLKGRRIAGDDVMGIEFLEQVKMILKDLPADKLRQEVLKMKNQMEKSLERRGSTWGEVKGGAGSIRDVEFITQYLQLVHARENPEIQSRNTLDGLARLTASGILSKQEYRILSEGYVFLRTIEHHLQVMHYRQTHQMPEDPQELTFLAKRLGFQGKSIGEKMVERYHQHRDAIRSVFDAYFSSPAERKAFLPAFDSQSAQARMSSRHLARMGATYASIFTDAEIKMHTEMAESLTPESPVKLHAQPLSDKDWRVTIVAFDALGELSVICGLLFEFGVDIMEGSIFTYEPNGADGPEARNRVRPYRRRWRPGMDRHDPRRKIVDVFTVRSMADHFGEEDWQRYREHLSAFVKALREKKQNEVQGELAKRVAEVMSRLAHREKTLLPVEIAVDNTSSQDYTVLRIDAPDTTGFLYEFTNALSLNGIYIASVRIHSLGNRVHDTLFVTDVQGRKITDPHRQYQLRLATALVKHFTHLLPHSPNPQSAMLNFRALIGNLFSQTDWANQLASLERPDVLETLSRLLGVSEFLWNDFLRMQHANLFPLVTDFTQLAYPKPQALLQHELEQQLNSSENWQDKVDAINSFKDREMFRIDMRYIMNVNPDLPLFSRELSDLADVVVQTVYELCRSQLEAQYGQPRLPSGEPCGLSVCALGKLGGREIGFASDIELIFIYEGEGHTDGAEQISNNEFAVKLVNKIRKSVKSRHEGIFEIDLRMRPYGKAGSLAVPFNLLQKYYGKDGAAWDYERQALVKLRPLAGDDDFSALVTTMRDALIYVDKPFVVSSLRAMRQRQVQQLVAGGTINAKFSPGGLVDLEYLVQGLQIISGKRHFEVRRTNTIEAMEALNRLGVLSGEEYASLRMAHLFLRRLIEALRMVRGNAKDLAVPTPDSDAFKFLARRLDYGDDAERLYGDLMQHTATVQKLSDQMLG